MKQYHYYANRELQRFDCPQSDQLPDSLITREIVFQVLRDNCERVDEIYTFTVPREIVFNIANVHHPNLDVTLTDGKSASDDPVVRNSPFDTAVLELPDAIVHIHCRRCAKL